MNMDISSEKQPSILPIDKELRLRKFDWNYDFALEWYRDRETVDMVDGKTSSIYDLEKLKRMYTFLNNKGELYFIEVKMKDQFIPIGDVTFSAKDIPIVIGDKSYRGKGIGLKVIKALIERARYLEFTSLQVNEIYSYNTASKRMFEKAGFKVHERREHGFSYILYL
ncbi:N-acetyltransferase [Clostridium manihotivorum]|uniref:N-acetyltransferase n=2 Tax=Clostridium manihotivorum TaxID=2320868 RepID=A0A410DWA9_9CLOT|nr:N-acetyltransferase [Clostridium manihotivorum]